MENDISGDKAMLVNALKIFGLLVLILVLVSGWIFYTQVYNYERFPLQVDKARFPGVNTEAEIDQLAESLLGQMTMDL